MSTAAALQLGLRDEALDVSERDDNIALLKKPPTRKSSRASFLLGRKSAHGIDTATTTGSNKSASRRHTLNLSVPSNSNSGRASHSRGGGGGESRSNSPNSNGKKNSSPDLLSLASADIPNPLRRTISTGSATVASNSTAGNSRRLLRRRTSIGSGKEMSSEASSVASANNSKRQCPATVSTIAKPSLLEKLQHDEKFRMPCPLPSIMGDSLEEGNSKDDTTTTTNNSEEPQKPQTQQTHHTSKAKLVFPSPDDEEDETERTNEVDGFFQFDPSKAKSVNRLVPVRSGSEDASIFAMYQTKDNDNDHDNDDDHSDLLQVAKKSKRQSHHDNNNNNHHQTKESREGENGATTSNNNKMTEGSMDGSDMPPLVPQSGHETGSSSNMIFDSAWNAEFTLQSDNARGHLDDGDDDDSASFHDTRKGLEEEDSDDDDDEDNDDIPSLTEMKNDKAVVVVERKETNDEDSTEERTLEDPSIASAESTYSDEETEEDEEPEGRDSNHSQALLQFNHKTPNGLDFAVCASDDTSIFRMDSIKTLEVPDVKTTELDKQLQQVTAAPKDRRPSMFAGALKKARSFKKPSSLMSAALVKAESFRADKKSMLLDTTDHTSLSKSDNEQWERRRSATEKTTRVRSHSVDRKSTTTITSENQKENIGDDELVRARTTHDMLPTRKDRAKRERASNSAGHEKAHSSSREIGDVSDKQHATRRDRVKGRRESARGGKSMDISNDDERKERRRKRDAVRKAAVAKNMPGRTISENSPKKRPGHIGQGRRRGTVAGDSSNIPKVDMDQMDLSKDGNTTMHESKTRRRSTIRKSQSVRNVASPPRSSLREASRKASLRRTASNDEGITVGTRRHSTNVSRRRPSEARSSGRSRGNKDREGAEHDIDRSVSREKRRHSRRPRRAKDVESKDDDAMDKSMDRSGDSVNGTRSRRRDAVDKNMDRSGESVNGTRSRRRDGTEKSTDRSGESVDGTAGRTKRRGEKRPSRRHRRSVERGTGGDGTEKSSSAMGGSSRHRGSAHSNGRGSNRGSNHDKKKTDNGSSTKSSAGTGTGTGSWVKSGNNSFVVVAKEGGETEEKRTSSLRVERTFDASFPDLKAANDSLSGTFHNDLETDGPTDRRKSFMKSLSSKFGAGQSTIGKGARNIIIGGTRAEKKRLLSGDDESVLS
ncbi:expressed unknown protein [Seminavis robusta]|uniref:Uncharacterized protein n=1 Tax=Seminavis robusta TaxID=568900 RepID=A0A9N8E0K3_9STRA|nr:expressed unknown protein [Seminavis robusta]|eukprot:Sro500_g155190.1 n/a (1166) ;mRNA; f:4362-7859